MSALEKWVSLAGSGDQSGDSPTNAKPVAQAGAWLQTVYAGWHTAMLQTPTDKGLNRPRTHTTVRPGVQEGYGPAFLSYITEVKQQVVYAQVNFIVDENGGEYDISTGSDGAAWWSFTEAHSGAGNSGSALGIPAGTTGNEHRIIRNCAYRLSDGKYSYEVSGGTETRTETMTAKDLSVAGADTNPANYTNGFWSGPTKQVTKSWQAALPSPIRFRVRGSRSPDPRTAAQRAFQVYNFDRSTTRRRWLPDIQSTSASADLTDPVTGKRQELAGGDIYDFNEGKVVGNVLPTKLGNYFIRAGASYMSWEGFDFINVGAGFTFSSAAAGAFKSFRDVTSENSRYGNWRGDNQVDVEFVRWKTVTNVQKQFVPGLNNARWYIGDQVFDGGYVVGDPIQNLVSVATDFNAGPMVVERAIVERIWDAVETLDGTVPNDYYPNGDGIESESWGMAVKDCYIKKTSDGGVDTKSSAYWDNYPAKVIIGSWIEEARRAIRCWAPGDSTRRSMSSRTVIRDTVTKNPRQYHLFLVAYPVAFNHIDWWNPSGLPHFTGAANGWAAVSPDGKLAGDIAVVLRRPMDGRTGTRKSWDGAANPNEVYDGMAPYKIQYYTPLAENPAVGVTIDGQAVDVGTQIQVADGATKRFALTGLPAGSSVNWSEIGPATAVQTGDVYDVTFRTVDP